MPSEERCISIEKDMKDVSNELAKHDIHILHNSDNIKDLYNKFDSISKEVGELKHQLSSLERGLKEDILELRHIVENSNLIQDQQIKEIKTELHRSMQKQTLILSTSITIISFAITHWGAVLEFFKNISH